VPLVRACISSALVDAVVKPCTTLAVLVEDEEDLAEVNGILATNPKAFDDCDEFTWQAYLKYSEKAAQSCGN